MHLLLCRKDTSVSALDPWKLCPRGMPVACRWLDPTRPAERDQLRELRELRGGHSQFAE